jgi:cob(I)alamin adenosyltransferase
MLNSTEQTKTPLADRLDLQAHLDEQIAFIDLELGWVSSDSIADSLEATRRELFAERFRLKIPATR